MEPKLGYKGLHVWQKSHELTIKIYRLSNKFPDSEKFGITSQLRRAAVSTELNIVEGKNRKGRKEFIQFLYTARASNQELNCILLICKDLEYINQSEFEEFDNYSQEIAKMLNAFINKLKS